MDFSLDRNYLYNSRRSVVMSPNAAVASSQPLATEAGLSVLRAGGSAADAAVAVAAALQVTQPCSTGLGGDAFFLYYEAATGEVHAYNGSGRSPEGLTREVALAAAAGTAGRGSTAGGESTALPDYHALTVTVPGAPDTWVALHERFGRLDLGTVLEPAIRHASDGFPVAPMASIWWRAGAERQLARHRHGNELMIDGRGPRPGERFRNPGLAHVLELMAADGREPFYTGAVADRIEEAVREAGGMLAKADLAAHAGEWVEPVSISYNGFRILECPPNGQGLAALIALGIYRELNPSGALESLHAQVESMRLGFADAARYVADPQHADVPVADLLSTGYLRARAALVDRGRRAEAVSAGVPEIGRGGDDTVYFSVADSKGNGCSFINSNFMGFGTGIVPEGCGFSLQNRGRGFVLEEGHANVVAPRKRPYHTIIPGLMTEEKSGALAAVFGVMGGMMQPQGHLQVSVAMINEGLDPQSALDMPRFQIRDGRPDDGVLVEASMPGELVSGLEKLGHPVERVDGTRRALFGLGQVIARSGDCFWTGSDPRGDGHAAGF